MNIEQIYKDANALLEGHFKLFFPPMTVEQRQETAKQ